MFFCKTSSDALANSNPDALDSVEGVCEEAPCASLSDLCIFTCHTHPTADQVPGPIEVHSDSKEAAGASGEPLATGCTVPDVIPASKKSDSSPPLCESDPSFPQVDSHSPLFPNKHTTTGIKPVSSVIFPPISNYRSSIFIPPASNIRWGFTPGMGLKGGGESSLNNGGPTGWGTTQNQNANWGGGAASNSSGVNPASNNANNPANNNSTNNGASNQWGATGNNATGAAGGVNVSRGGTAPPPSTPAKGTNQSVQSPNEPDLSQQTNPTSWAQAAGKGLPPSSTVSNTQPTSQSNQPPNGQQQMPTTPNTPNSASKQLEQLNTMREALLSQDGWGGQHVNQDSQWDVQLSPTSSPKDSGPVWKATVNNGTDLWEATLRNGGSVPQPVVQKVPWGHTPATNIGGTWGEDEEVTDTSNVWTGVPPSNGSGHSGPGPQSQWGGHQPTNQQQQQSSGSMWGGNGPKKEGDWVGPNGPQGGPGPGPGGWSEQMGPPRNPLSHMNGENGNPNWNQQQPPNPNTPGGGKWMDKGGKSGWEEPSPPTQRRPMTNYDDGTSLWGTPQPNNKTGMTQHQQMQQQKQPHWKEMGVPGGRGPGVPGPMTMAGHPGMGGPRLPPNGPNSLKLDGNPTTMWGTPRNTNGGGGPWDGGGPHEPPMAPWDEGNKGWSGENTLPTSWGGPKPKTPTGGPWGDGSMDMMVDPSWQKGGPQVPKVPKEHILGSRQMRILTDMGFKKEDAEMALRAHNMSIEDALEALAPNRLHLGLTSGTLSGVAALGMGGGGGGGDWGRVPHHNPHQQHHNPHGLGMPNHHDNTGGPGGVPPFDSFPTHPGQGQQRAAFGAVQGQQNYAPPGSGRVGAPNQTSPAQLRLLVQQIQMAVQAGHLNPQILSQPLAPSTLLLLNQLLQQIKALQNLLQAQAQAQGIHGKGNSTAALQLAVQITKTKQQVSNLHNQIAAQQALYAKQQQHINPQSGGGDFYKPVMHDHMASLQATFGELAMKDPQLQMGQQSRLNQWKLPPLEKDMDGSSEFSRAPGSASAKPSMLNPLLGQGESATWGSSSANVMPVGRVETGGWPESNIVTSSSDVGKESQWGGNSQNVHYSALTDLVPEFEPGKPWKGAQMKSVEEDPNLTPGSVAPSPLSLVGALKDSENSFVGVQPPKGSPSPQSDGQTMPPLSLSASSTWSFTPPTSSAPFSSSLNKLGGGNKTWSDGTSSSGSELWGGPGAGNQYNKTSGRGPPPGLSPQQQLVNKPSGNPNAWGSGGVIGGGRSSWGGGPPNAPNTPPAPSSWLLLKNLTPQIDGSTLKTLCLQHGPLHNFHLYLNHGVALVKYSQREEAAKAKGALTNCVLGNTTILAESTTETEAHGLLQQLGQGGGSSVVPNPTPTSAWGSPANPNAVQKTQDPWQNSAWGGPTGGSLWGAPDNSANSNSYLPGDLLGGESI